MYLKSEIAKEEKKSQAAAQKVSCLCGCHYSVLQSLQVPREFLVQESFRQAGLWDCTVPCSHVSHHTHCRKFQVNHRDATVSPDVSCGFLLEERVVLAKQGHIYITARDSLFPSAFG